MPLDPLTDPIWMYLKELVSEVRKKNAPVHILDEFEWVGDAHGNVRKTFSERPFLGFAFAMHRDSSTLYSSAMEAIQRDEVFGKAINKMIGDEGGQSRFDSHILFIRSLQGITNPNGSFSVTKASVSKKLSELRRYLTASTSVSTLLIPLPGVNCDRFPFFIDKGIEVDLLSPKEVGWCVEAGALRLVNNDIPVLWAGDCVGIRIKIESAVKISTQEELENSSDERLRYLNEETARDHNFGAVSRWKIPDCVEDLLFVLRLARPEFIGTDGAVLVSERPTGRSSTWTGRSTRPLVRTSYQIDSSTGRVIRSYWRQLKAKSGKLGGLPTICERRFNAAMDRVSWDDAIIDHLIAAEALFLRDAGSPEDRGELGYRLSLRAATLLEEEPERRAELFKFMRAAYAQRSYIAHGGPSREKIKVSGRTQEVPINEFVEELSGVIRKALQQAILMYTKDSTFATSEYWDSLILRK